MYEMKTKLSLDKDLIRSSNLAEHMDEEDLKHLGHCVVEDFNRDRNSREEWEDKTDKSLKLALQVCEQKTFPWQGAANVKFPLVTIAAIQYSSRAYPALVSGPLPVHCAPIFDRPNPHIPPGLQQAAQQDPAAQKALQQISQQAQQAMMQWKEVDDRARRISRHMSYQLLEEDPCWEDNQDKALLIQCIMGCVFKKTFFDPVGGIMRSECVNPRDFVISYYTKNLETSSRYTHILYLTSNECYERCARGLFCEFVEGTPDNAQPTLRSTLYRVADERQGTAQQPSDSDPPIECLEQYLYLDLDGDGYKEPYVCTVRYDTRQVLRLVARFTSKDITFSPARKVLRINPVDCFTKYGFIPSPDGGFYDLGFGALLGPINETIDSSINQLLDAGTLANAGGGFLGRGFRNKKGEYRFRPGEWKTVESTGDDLRKSILPLPAPQPNAVLFQLLSLLIEYSESIAGATDILQGKNPGQNTPAETSRAMVEQGMKVFNGIYKRTHRAFGHEIKKMFKLNTIYCTGENFYGHYISPWAKMMAKDYAAPVLFLIKPSAEPEYMSDAQRYNQAAAVREASMTKPGYNQYEVETYYLTALKVGDPDRFFPDPTGPFAVPPPVNPKVQIEQIRQQSKQSEMQQKFKEHMMDLAAEQPKLEAEIAELEARAKKEMAEADGVQTGHAIAMMDAQIAAKKHHLDAHKAHLDGMANILKMLKELSQGGSSDSKEGGTGGVANPSGIARATQALAGPSGPSPSPMGAGTPPIGL